MEVSVVIVGAGFAGSIIAERVANELNQKVLLIEKRNHIGGNVYDHYDTNGVLVHKYGPHIFHTNQQHVWDYLSQFTDWILYQHKVLGEIDGKLVPIPFNLDSLKALFDSETASRLEKKLIEHFGKEVKVPILEMRKVNDPDLQKLADFIYEKIFLHYTKKQWGMTPEELNPAVTGRVPAHISEDDRYFQDEFQGMPKHGYTPIFEKMLSNPNIKIMLNTDYKDVLNIDVNTKEVFLFGKKFTGKIVFSGKIDELYNYKYGELPYRSLCFAHKYIPNVEKYQPTGTVNYPNNHAYTRITEFKHLTGQKTHGTSIVEEYPQAYEKDVSTDGKNIPYYPIPQPKNQDLYQRYKQEASEFKQLVLLGRLAEYHYYDMHQIIAKALKVFKEEFSI